MSNQNFAPFNEYDIVDVYAEENNRLKNIDGVIFKNPGNTNAVFYRGTLLKLTGNLEFEPFTIADTAQTIPMGILMGRSTQDPSRTEPGAIDGDRIAMDAYYSERLNVVSDAAIAVGVLVSPTGNVTTDDNKLPEVTTTTTGKRSNWIVLKASTAAGEQIQVAKMNTTYTAL